ncbi:DNA-binding transcriptional regulator, LacI/PurR family [Halolactibacillus halophilus]|uniref:DNA-binding transcriptional regulator, LacI/PurR family n=1 Tax=Halolactibacillus halophilus TaxID=306540 RepID=A0A1I5LVS6_9BACI|nr:LacI family DNA-binding transcriptional regulator [Halolactibacillus halophilus]GEM00896.1 LacI family transcriptional regulator [Halolactibacillus halophilus]SFP01322.1 DNA-binding transcriptional regulator, LacI/PurR family [Halolactibacillus halophilus]
MAVTIKDVAKKAGVAPSTVSRVIADSPRISTDTKKRVRKAMKELGYHPNVNARNLAVRSSKAIGVIMPSSAETALQNPFFPEVLRGVGTVAHDTEYSLYVSTGGNDQQLYEEVKRMVYGHRVDGIILLYSRMNDAIMDFLVEEKFPFVVVGKPYENESSITYVDNDNVSASKELTKHLIDFGHKNIAFIGGTTDLVVTSDRFEGYKQALIESGIKVREDYIINDEFNRSSGKKAVEKLLKLKNPPTAMVISDDMMSLGVINMLEEFGLDCPEDVSITSFNNLYLSEITRPPLTTVDIQIYKLGIQGAKCLIEQLQTKDEPAKRVIVPYAIKYRSSTKRFEP